MTEQVRLTISLEESLATALRLRAARENLSPLELIGEILRKALGPEIEEATGGRPLAAVIQDAFKATAARPTMKRKVNQTLLPPSVLTRQPIV